MLNVSCKMLLFSSLCWNRGHLTVSCLGTLATELQRKPHSSRERLNNRDLVLLQTLSFILLTFSLLNIKKVSCGKKDLLS